MSSLVLVLIDWENTCKDFLRQRTNPERFSRAAALRRLFDWLASEVDEVFDTFVFAPLHMAYTDHQLLYDNKLIVTACPKIPLGSAEKRDTVDPILIKRGLKWITHPSLTHICLVSGDSDFIPLLKVAKSRDLLIMISGPDPKLARDPNCPSLSRELEKMADISPKTGARMLHYFSPMI